VSVRALPAAEAIERLAEFSAVIDARSEDEFALDRLPGAINWPSLNNEERKRVGTMYVQVSPFEAQKHGAALVAANIARHIEREVLDKPRHWQPLVYCWRGGKRSGSLALVLGRSAFGCTPSKAATRRSAVRCWPPCPPWRSGFSTAWCAGPRGRARPGCCRHWSAQGAQVLDLEALASHRSSVLGMFQASRQPSQSGSRP
jgi:tRNA 2-selenouridine synthase